MGFDIWRFRSEVDEELICPICSAVLEDPLQAPACEHAFCRACITEWISRQPTCPVDRQSVTSSQLKPVPRILRNLLSRLLTSCDNAPHGCTAVLKLDSLALHLVECEFNPKRPTPCKAGCGLVIAKDKLSLHNCIQELRAMISTQQVKLTEYQQELADHRSIINEHKREIALLKEPKSKGLPATVARGLKDAGKTTAKRKAPTSAPKKKGMRGRPPGKKGKKASTEEAEESSDESSEGEEDEEESEEEGSEDSEAPAENGKRPPTDDEVKEYVKQILNGANLEQITMKSLCRQVYSHYPDFNLEHKKEFIKSTVRSCI